MEAIPSTNLYHSVEKKRYACKSLTRFALSIRIQPVRLGGLGGFLARRSAAQTSFRALRGKTFSCAALLHALECALRALRKWCSEAPRTLPNPPAYVALLMNWPEGVDLQLA